MHIIDLQNLPEGIAGSPDFQALVDSIPEAAGLKLSLSRSCDGRYVLEATSVSGLAVAVSCSDAVEAVQCLSSAVTRTAAILDAAVSERPGASHPMSEQPDVYGTGIVASLSLIAASGTARNGVAQ
jgi:hypothetical protein